jgi:hypothetical protein
VERFWTIASLSAAEIKSGLSLIGLGAIRASFALLILFDTNVAICSTLVNAIYRESTYLNKTHFQVVLQMDGKTIVGNIGGA